MKEIEFADYMIQMIFETEMEKGTSFSELMNEMIKGEDKDKEIMKEFKKLGGKPNKNMIDLARIRTKMHVLELLLRSDVFENNEALRFDFANYLIELANDLRFIKGNCSK